MGDLRIQTLDGELVRKIRIIAKDNYDSITKILQPVIREIVDSCDRSESVKSKSLDFKLRSVPDELLEQLDEAAKKMGVSPTALLKVKLYEFVENQSDIVKSLF